MTLVNKMKIRHLALFQIFLKYTSNINKYFRKAMQECFPLVIQIFFRMIIP